MPQNQALITGKAMLPRALRIVPYLTPAKVAAMARACQGRTKSMAAMRRSSYDMIIGTGNLWWQGNIDRCYERFLAQVS